MESRLYINGLGQRTTKKDIQKHFEDYADITDIFIPIVKMTKNNRGFGFIGFKSKRSAIDAVDNLNNTYIGTHKISLSFSEAKSVPKQLSNDDQEINTFIIKNVNNIISYDELYALFSHIGPISNVELRKIKTLKPNGNSIESDNNDTKVTISFQNTIPASKINLIENTIYKGQQFNIKTSFNPNILNYDALKDTNKFSLLKNKHREEIESKRGNWAMLYFNAQTLMKHYNNLHSTKKSKKNLAVELTALEHKLLNKAKAEIKSFKFNFNDVSMKTNTLAFEKKRIGINTDPTVIILRPFVDICTDKFERFKEDITLLEPCKETSAIRILICKNNSVARNIYFKFKGADFAPRNLLIKDTEEVQKVNEQIEIRKKEWDIVCKVLNYNETKEITEHEVFEFFRPVGNVADVNIIKGASKDVVIFVSFEEEISKHLSVKELNGTKFKDYKTLISNYKKCAGKIVRGDGSKIIIKNIPFYCKEKELKELIKKYGKYKTVRMPKMTNDKEKNKGFVFVEFDDKDTCKKVVDIIKELHFYGRKLVVEYAN
eukprot:GAHX01000272.1.p1 GENE.GAHX01000272.1~~GAHX01000272.1.p1  ORF type:complete len:560 (+),score=138.90 GAHX01000272.1:48-1682(+)